MFAICIEASHKKGMGHLFRMLNFVKYLKSLNEEFIFIINDNEKTKEILKAETIKFKIVDLENYNGSWEREIIQNYNILFWINDRLDTSSQHSINIKELNVKLITLDDLGCGAKLSDINICGLFFNKSNLNGKMLLKGSKYLILNSEIDRYKKVRNKLNNILVTLGGSDTYGVTIKVLKILKKYNIKATIHTGPSFLHLSDLKKELTNDYKVIYDVSSLIKEFSEYDLAITGGGVTPYEANASGLPCLIIANELFEVANGEFLSKQGSSKFIGHYKSLDETIFNQLDNLDIGSMSKIGLEILDTKASEKIYKEIKSI